MFSQDKKKFTYSNDLKIKQIKTNFWVIVSYLFVLFLWQYTLSFQSSMFTLMNTCVFIMFAFGTVGLFICQEERENIIKHTKSQIIYYLLVTFLYDMFFKIVLTSMNVSASLGDVDTSLQVARQFILTFSTVIKIGFPIAFVVWMLQKFSIFKSGFTKRKQMAELRNTRENNREKGKDANIGNLDRF